jgi:dTDP-4-dehydrorhamnose 3,5-epimerase
MNKILVTRLTRIPAPKGDVLHGIKATDPGFVGFGEAYFSFIHRNEIKGWKRHRRMTLNLVCPFGMVRVVVHDGTEDSTSRLTILLSPDTAEHYCRVTVPPMYWVGFEGIAADHSILLNVASQPHDPAEADSVDIDAFPWPSPA